MGTVTVEFPNVREEDSFALPEGFSIDLPGPREDDDRGVKRLVPNRDEDMRLPGRLEKMFDYTPGTRESTNVEVRPAPAVKGWMSIFNDDDDYDVSNFTVPKGFKIENEGDWSAEVIEPMVKDEGSRYPFEYHPEEILQGRNARTYNYSPSGEGWRGSTPRKGEAHDISFQLPEGFTIDTPMGMTGLSDMGDAPSSQLGVPGDTDASGKGLTEGLLFKENPDGSIVFKPSDSLKRFMTSKDPRDQERAAWEIATTLASGGFARGAIASKGTLGAVDELGVFGGKQAKTYVETGMKGADNQPRFEINDSTMSFKKTGIFRKSTVRKNEPEGMAKNENFEMRAPQKLGELIDHPELFEAYPDLKKVPVDAMIVETGTYQPPSGSWNGFRLTARASNEKDLKKTLIHEIQHWVQHKEDFETGGNPKEFNSNQLYQDIKAILRGDALDENAVLMNKSEIEDLMSAITLNDARFKGKTIADVQAAFSGNASKVEGMSQELTKQVSFLKYRRLQGEVEARNAADRLEMSAYERDQIPPWITEDTPRNRQIFTESGARGINESTEGPRVVKGGTEVVKENVDELHNNLVKALKEGTKPDLKAARKNIKALRETAKGIMKESEDLLPPLRKEDADAMDMTMDQYKWYLLDDLMTEIDYGTRRTFEAIVGGRDPDKAVTSENLVQWLKDSGITDIKIEQRGKSKTEYITFKDPANARALSRGGTTEVRIPADAHPGKRPFGQDAGGGRLDTASGIDEQGRPVNPLVGHNVSGGSFSKWENLIDALKWRLSRAPDGQFLISPGQEPIPRVRGEAYTPAKPKKPKERQLNFDLNLPPNET